MSSCFILRQSKSISMMTESMGYTDEGVIVSNNINKSVALATLPAVVSALGSIQFIREFTSFIENRFASFDEMIDEGEEFLEGLFMGLADRLFDGDALTVVYLIGWHARENRPGGYMANYWTDDSTKYASMVAEFGAARIDGRNRGKLQEIELGDIHGTPLYDVEGQEKAGFELRETEDYVPAVDLLHLTEIARHTLHDDGTSRQGGKAVLSTVDGNGISQRVVHHWKEDDDTVGVTLRPAPIISWSGWRAARLLASASPNFEIAVPAPERALRQKSQKGNAAMSVEPDDVVKYALANLWAAAVTDRAMLQLSGLDQIPAGQSLLVESIALMTGFDRARCQLIAIEFCQGLIEKQRAALVAQDNDRGAKDGSI